MSEKPIERTRERPKAAVFAYSEVGCVCLEELLSLGANVAAVFTHEDDPDEKIWFRSVRDIASARGITPIVGAKPGADAVRILRDLGVEVIFSFYYRAIIPEEVLKVARLGAYNLHGALLPKYRGRACVNWAVLNGETETGATLHVMTKYADRGDIVDREAVQIAFEDTALDVFMKIARVSGAIIRRSLGHIEAGNAPGTPQDESQATTFGRRRPEDGIIDWNKKAVEVYNQVRALTHPFPGAFTFVDGEKYFVWRARVTDETSNQCNDSKIEPGSVVSRTPFLIAARDGMVEILSWQRDGCEERSNFF